jgi:hypothetical protein
MHLSMKPALSLLIGGLIGSTLVLAQNATWDKEPESFKGAKFLTSESEVRSKLKMANCVNRDNNEKTCFFFFTLADTEIDSEATFQNDALVDVTGAFSQADFNRVLGVFTEAYGTPFGNSVPLPLGTDQYRWGGKSMSIRMERLVTDERSGDLKTIISSVCQAHRDAEREIDAFRQNQIKQRFAGIDARDGGALSALLRAIEEGEADHKKGLLRAETGCKTFSGKTFGLFSITVSNYAAEVEKRKAEEKRKAADSLK